MNSKAIGQPPKLLLPADVSIRPIKTKDIRLIMPIGLMTDRSILTNTGSV